MTGIVKGLKDDICIQLAIFAIQLWESHIIANQQSAIDIIDFEIYKMINEKKHFQLAVEYDENMNILSFVDEMNGVEYSQYIGMNK